MPSPSVFFRLHPSLQQVLHSTLHWTELREIQEMAYMPVVSGTNVLLMARTAGGKSEAAFIPVIDQILKKRPHFPFCLYISPLRALLSDLSLRLDTILAPLHLTTLQVHGDAPKSDVSSPDIPAILMTTPESLTVLFYGGSSHLLSEVQICVIDEVHALSGSERGAQLMAVLSLIEAQYGHDIQRIGLSATIGNPESVLIWMTPPGRQVELIRPESESFPREFVFLTGWGEGEERRLSCLLRGKRSLIFAKSRSEAEDLSSRLVYSGIPVYVHHSSLSSPSRREAEEAFLHRQEGTIICTSTLELGIDIGSLDLVVQSGPSWSISSFLQRLGRVGRRGNQATLVFLLKDGYETLLAAALIAAAAAGLVEPVIPVRYPYRMLVQQIILPLLSQGRCSIRNLKERLSLITPATVPDDRVVAIISYLIEEGVILPDRGYVMPGPALDGWDWQKGSLFSVFGEGRMCDIRTNTGDQVGILPLPGANDVRSRPFRLGGKTWTPSTSDPGDENIRVTESLDPAEPPVFSGSSPGMSPTLLQMAASIIRDGLPNLPFPQTIRHAVDEMVTTFPSGTGPGTVLISGEDEGFRVYTFLGNDWNRMISWYLRQRYEQDHHSFLKTGVDEVSVWVSSRLLDPGWIHDTLSRLAAEDTESVLPWLAVPSVPARLYDQFLPDLCLQEMTIGDRFRFYDLAETLKASVIRICQ